MRTACVVAVALVVWADAASGQPSGKKIQVCALLTSSELAALGASGPGEESETKLTEGVAKGQPMRTCGWRMPPQGSVVISVVQSPPGAKPIDEQAAHAAEIAQMNDAFKAMKAQGWQEEIKDFGTIRCMVHTPPASLKALV